MGARGKMGRVVFPFSFARSSLVAGRALIYKRPGCGRASELSGCSARADLYIREL